MNTKTYDDFSTNGQQAASNADDNNKDYNDNADNTKHNDTIGVDDHCNHCRHGGDDGDNDDE